MKDNEDTSANDDKLKEICAEIEAIEKEQLKIGDKYREEIKALDKTRHALIDSLPHGIISYIGNKADDECDEFEDLEA